MCGIVGYIGDKSAAPILVEGLRRLEYRGYDSAGAACRNSTALQVVKSAGRLQMLEQALAAHPLAGTIGIAHTRWATHGAPTDANAHPHTDCTGAIGVVHNGIVENYLELRAWLIERGHTFHSETDSEVIAHLIEEFAGRAAASQNGTGRSGGREPRLLGALQAALGHVEGSYAIVVLDQHDPDFLLAARKDSPLVIGLGEEENYIASDIPAIVARTRRMLILEDGEIAVVGKERVALQDLSGHPVRRAVMDVDWDPGKAEKAGYDHFMLKEIHEQPAALRAALAGRIHTGHDGLRKPRLEHIIPQERLRDIERVVIVAAGTAYHAGLLGREWIRQWTALPVEVELASEFRYRNPQVNSRTLAVVVSQSGETADTLAALREAARRGAEILAITNVMGSSIAREAAHVLYTQAGPEIAVASTKAYTTQLVCLALLGVYMAGVCGSMDPARTDRILAAMSELARQQEESLVRLETEIRAVGVQWGRITDVFYVGRGLDYPLAMEGQLKLKEVSYIHAEALAAGELKHGTLALITEGIPVVALLTQPQLLEKSISNIREVKARGAEVLALARDDENKGRCEQVADQCIYLPATDPDLMPILAALPLQLLAYYAAVNRGCDVDHPRNLAKSVTVE